MDKGHIVMEGVTIQLDQEKNQKKMTF